MPYYNNDFFYKTKCLWIGTPYLITSQILCIQKCLALYFFVLNILFKHWYIVYTAVGTTPEALLQKIEEETKVNTYIVMQKLPKEIETKRKTVENLQKVIDQPALGQDDIASLKENIKMTRVEIEELTNKKNVSNDPIEDKLTLFRQRVCNG